MKVHMFRCLILFLVLLVGSMFSLHAQDAEDTDFGSTLRVHTEEVLLGEPDAFDRIEFQFADQYGPLLTDEVIEKIKRFLKARDLSKPIALSICGLDPEVEFPKLKKIIAELGIPLHQLNYDPKRHESTAKVHALIISGTEGLLGFYGWVNNAAELGFVRGFGFMVFRAAVAYGMTSKFAFLLDYTRLKRKQHEEQYAGLPGQVGRWFTMNWAINWLIRLITGPINEAHPVFRLPRQGEEVLDVVPDVVAGNIEVFTLALLSIINSSVLPTIENKLLEYDRNGNPLDPNYAKLLKQYGNLLRFFPTAIIVFFIQIGLHGPIVAEAQFPSGESLIKLTALDLTLIGVSAGFLSASKLAPNGYRHVIRSFTEISRKFALNYRGRKGSCIRLLSHLRERPDKPN